jgi:hypothetical protein
VVVEHVPFATLNADQALGESRGVNDPQVFPLIARRPVSDLQTQPDFAEARDRPVVQCDEQDGDRIKRQAQNEDACIDDAIEDASDPAPHDRTSFDRNIPARDQSTTMRNAGPSTAYDHAAPLRGLGVSSLYSTRGSRAKILTAALTLPSTLTLPRSTGEHRRRESDARR